MIEIRELRKSYGRLTVLSGITLEIGTGEIFALLGANGSGKSTILRCLMGLTEYQGCIRVAGLDPLRQGKAVRSLVGYMPQNAGLHLDLTVAETMDFYVALRKADSARGLHLLQESELASFSTFKIEELSGGLRQRLALVIAQLTDPPLLVLDEPTSSLDAQHRRRCVEQLREVADRGTTILVSTHSHADLLMVADRAAVLEEGRLAGGGALAVWEAGQVAMEGSGCLKPSGGPRESAP